MLFIKYNYEMRINIFVQQQLIRLKIFILVERLIMNFHMEMRLQLPRENMNLISVIWVK